MIGYKCTDKDGCCRGFKFEVGKTYTKDTKKEDLRCWYEYRNCIACKNNT